LITIIYFSVGHERRRVMLWALFKQLIEKNTQLFTHPFKVAYDCGALLVTTEKLPLENGFAKVALDPVSPTYFLN
jgi:hypothetical protein